jgi:hypothetical protein
MDLSTLSLRYVSVDERGRRLACAFRLISVKTGADIAAGTQQLANNTAPTDAVQPTAQEPT